MNAFACDILEHPLTEAENERIIKQLSAVSHCRCADPDRNDTDRKTNAG